MSTTDIRRRNRYNRVTALSGLSIASAAPTDNQALTYNATTQYLTPTSVLLADEDVTIAGNKTFSDGVRFGADGTTIKQLRFQQTSVPSVAAGASNISNITFSPAFNSVPIVLATVQAYTGIIRLNVVIRSLTASGCTVLVSSQIQNVTNPVTINLLLIEQE